MLKGASENENTKSIIHFFYLTPFFVNLLVGWYFKKEIVFKGAIVSGISLKIVATCILSVMVFSIYAAYDELYQINKNYLSKTRLLVLSFSSPFVIIWIITLIYQNFSPQQYHYFTVNALLYSLLFVFQFKFIKKIKNYVTCINNY